VLLGSTRQLIGPPWTTAGPFVYAGNIGPWRLADATTAMLDTLGKLVAERAGLEGLFGVDFLLHENEEWVLEVNPRYPASLEILERATGAALLGHHLAACLQGELLPPPNFSPDARCHGKAIVYARTRCTIDADQAGQWLVEACEAEPSVADVPAAGTVIEPGQPVLTRFASGRTVEEVEEQLRAEVARGE
jgi:predicted ATP-grasp superfamily ATP-dependent carboligase